MEKIKINNQKDILKIGLTDMNDKPILDEKGEVVYWEFDLSDIELPLKWNKIEFNSKKNREYVRNQFIIIDKKQDVKGKYLLSKNEEEKIKVMNEYYKRETENINSFLGEEGVEKFLNGRKPYWDMFDDINDAIKQVLPKFENVFDNINNRIKEKYKENNEENVLE